jgi:hypothetical protein
MKMKSHFQHFLQTFFHPRVFAFILAGTLIIFLTFLTSNNAIEIAISGIASVFIGIGVNNLSSLETRLNDERKLKSKTENLLTLLEIIKSKITKLYAETNKENCTKIKGELSELVRFMNLSIQMIKDYSSLD